MDPSNATTSHPLRLVSAAIVLGISFIIGAGGIAGVLYKTRLQRDMLSVTGSARAPVVSDAVKWVSGYSRTVESDGIREGYALMRADEQEVQAFLKERGIPDEAIVVSPVIMEEQYQYDPNAPRRYVLRQTVEVRSGDVEGVTAIAKNVRPLIEKGVLFASAYLEYTYTKLPEARISLLADAMADARARASAIAESGGRTIGSVVSAESGVVQVLQVNSTEVSDYGSYDTSTIEKEVMVTVRPTFVLE
jgi:hypothetical protein